MTASGAGIIGDIGTPAERGGFFGLFGLGALVGACGLCFEKVSNGLSVRLVPVLVPSSEGLWLRDLAGGTIDSSYRSRTEVNRTSLGPFSGSCASALLCAASDFFCWFR